MKLSKWAQKQGISYITAWRWFNENKLPVKAYRSDSGTIIVQDESEVLEQPMNIQPPTDTMSLFLKKTVEFSKNNGSVEDFAAWVLSTFTLKLNNTSDSPKYSRVKPKPEEVQKHFQQFLKPKGEKPKPNFFVSSEETLEKIAEIDGSKDEEAKLAESLELLGDSNFLTTDDFSEFSMSYPEVTVYDNSNNIGIEGVVTGVDLTPQQQLNYTGSANYSFNTGFNPNTTTYYSNTIMPTNDGVTVTGKLLSEMGNVLIQNTAIAQPQETTTVSVKSKRGRKPFKNTSK